MITPSLVLAPLSFPMLHLSWLGTSFCLSSVYNKHPKQDTWLGCCSAKHIFHSRPASFPNGKCISLRQLLFKLLHYMVKPKPTLSHIIPPSTVSNNVCQRTKINLVISMELRRNFPNNQHTHIRQEENITGNITYVSMEASESLLDLICPLDLNLA